MYLGYARHLQCHSETNINETIKGFTPSPMILFLTGFRNRISNCLATLQAMPYSQAACLYRTACDCVCLSAGQTLLSADRSSAVASIREPGCLPTC